VVNVSRKFAINEYQRKFSYFSQGYGIYLNTHKNIDAQIGYILNGEPLGNITDRIKTLFNISDKKIKTFDFFENPFFNGGNSKKQLAVITTKQ
jgi:hypothetical protein